MTSISNILDVPEEVDKQEVENAKQVTSKKEPIVDIPIESHIEIIQQIYPNDGTTLTPTVVYVARDNLNKRDVILKKIIKKMLDSEGMELAVQEQKLQLELQHQNIVSGIGNYEEQDAFCIVMEFVDFADYFKIKLIENYKPIRNETKIKMYLTDILNGLKYLHDQNIVHLDLKLENLYCYMCDISDDITIRKVKIGDFGIAKRVDPVTKKVFIKNAIGTRDYMAPEIKKNTEISLACDIWSFGIILYQMVTGYVPTMVAGFQYEKDAELPFRKRDWKKIPNAEQLQQFLNRILKYNPEDRPTVDELLQDSYLNN